MKIEKHLGTISFKPDEASLSKWNNLDQCSYAACCRLSCLNWLYSLC